MFRALGCFVMFVCLVVGGAVLALIVSVNLRSRDTAPAPAATVDRPHMRRPSRPVDGARNEDGAKQRARVPSADRPVRPSPEDEALRREITRLEKLYRELSQPRSDL